MVFNMSCQVLRVHSGSFSEYEPKSSLEIAQEQVHAYVGSRDYSLRFSSSLVDRVWHAFCECIVAVASLFSNIQASREKVSISGFEKVAPNLTSQIRQAQKLLAYHDPKLKTSGLELFKQLVLLKAKIELSDNYSRLYDESLLKSIEDTRAQIAHSSFSLLSPKAQGKIVNQLALLEARFIKENQGFKSEEFKSFISAMKDLANLAKTASKSPDLLSVDKRANDAKRSIEEETIYQLIRWADGCDLQFKLAAFCPTHQLPYRAEEVPKGAVLLTNGDLYLVSKSIRGIPVGMGDWFRGFKAGINQLGTGSRALHAELSLGNGKIIHQEKDSNDGFKGVTEILDRSNRLDQYGRKIPVVLTHDIMLPKQEQFSLRPVSFNRKINQMVSKADKMGYNVITTLFSMIKVGMSNLFHRQKDESHAFNPLRGHDPKNPLATQPLSCSAFIASIYADNGLDITEETDRSLSTYSPGDFARSEYFEAAFKSGDL
jgi:hypothetical protein